MDFFETIELGFPYGMRGPAASAAIELKPYVNLEYSRVHSAFTSARVSGQEIRIPQRMAFSATISTLFDSTSSLSPAASCLVTRSNDGFLRQLALRRIVRLDEAWAIPYVVLLSGDYVAEIGQELVDSLSHLNRDAYARFIRENPLFIRLMSNRAASYYDRFYRHQYSKLREYPSRRFILEIEGWARSLRLPTVHRSSTGETE